MAVSIVVSFAATQNNEERKQKQVKIRGDTELPTLSKAPTVLKISNISEQNHSS